MIGVGALTLLAVLLASTSLDVPTPPSRGDGTAVELPTAAGTPTPGEALPTLDPPAPSTVSFAGCGETLEPAETDGGPWTTHVGAPFRGEPVVDERGQLILIGRGSEGSTRLAHWVPQRLQWGCASVTPGLGEEVKVAAGRDVIAAFDGDDVGILDLPAQTWRETSAPPVTGLPLGVGFSSGEFLVFAQSGPNIAAASYDLATGTWSELASPDATVSRASVVPFGSRYVVLGRWSGMEAADGDDSVVGMVYDPRPDTWQVLPPVQLTPLAVVGAEAGGRLVAVDYLMRAAVYDASTEGWQALPDVPLDPMECSPTLVTTGPRTIVLARCGEYAAFDVGTERWAPVDPPEPVTPDGRGMGRLVGRQGRVFLLADDGHTFSTRPASWLEDDPNEDRR